MLCSDYEEEIIEKFLHKIRRTTRQIVKINMSDKGCPDNNNNKKTIRQIETDYVEKIAFMLENPNILPQYLKFCFHN